MTTSEEKYAAFKGIETSYGKIYYIEFSYQENPTWEKVHTMFVCQKEEPDYYQRSRGLETGLKYVELDCDYARLDNLVYYRSPNSTNFETYNVSEGTNYWATDAFEALIVKNYDYSSEQRKYVPVEGEDKPLPVRISTLELRRAIGFPLKEMLDFTNSYECEVHPVWCGQCDSLICVDNSSDVCDHLEFCDECEEWAEEEGYCDHLKNRVYCEICYEWYYENSEWCDHLLEIGPDSVPAKAKLTLDEMVDQITPENVHPEVDWGFAVGKEIIEDAYSKLDNSEKVE